MPSGRSRHSLNDSEPSRFARLGSELWTTQEGLQASDLQMILEPAKCAIRWGEKRGAYYNPKAQVSALEALLKKLPKPGSPVPKRPGRPPTGTARQLRSGHWMMTAKDLLDRRQWSTTIGG